MDSKRYVILVADNRPDVIESACSFLKQVAAKYRKQVQILTATSALQVLKILRDQQVDAIFLDYHFEAGMSGDEVIDHIPDPFSHMVIILMSGREPDELEHVITKHRKRLGSRFKFLRKPFDQLEIQDKFLEIEQFFLEKPLPYPVAHVYNVLQSSPTAHAQVTAIKDVIEVLVKYSTAVLMSDLARLKYSQKGFLKFNHNQNLTLGAWLTWFDNALLQFDAIPAPFMPEIPMLFQAGAGVVNYRQFLMDFKRERDDELGHGYVKDEGSYETVVEKWLPGIEQMVKDFSFLKNYPLFMPEEIDFTDDGSDRIAYKVRLMLGATPQFQRSDLSLSHRLRKNEIYLTNTQGEVLALKPFLIYEACEQCSSSCLFIIDKIEGNAIRFSDFYNHRLANAACKKDFLQKFGDMIK